MTIRRLIAQFAVVALLAFGSIVGMSGVASAVPSGCSSGIGYNVWGAARFYYAWANCTGGTGYYRVTASCYEPGGGYTFPRGPTLKVGQGQSRVACVDWHRPTGQWVTSWS